MDDGTTVLQGKALTVAKWAMGLTALSLVVAVASLVVAFKAG